MVSTRPSTHASTTSPRATSGPATTASSGSCGSRGTRRAWTSTRTSCWPTSARSSALLTDIDEGFAQVDALLAEQRTDDGYVLYTDLSQAEIQQFADAVAAVSESVSQVAAVVVGQ